MEEEEGKVLLRNQNGIWRAPGSNATEEGINTKNKLCSKFLSRVNAITRKGAASASFFRTLFSAFLLPVSL